MKHFASGLVSLSIVIVALICMQATLRQNEAVARPLADQPAASSPVLSSNDPITPTGYFTSYLPIVSWPEAIVAGHIADNDTPIANVLISTTLGRSTTTDANGNYQLHLPNGSHTLTPLLAGYSFAPTQLLVDVSADMSGLNFEAVPPPCTAGATVFFDNFSNGNSGWGEENIAAWYRHYIDNEYEAALQVNTELHQPAPNVGNTLDNFIVSADMRQTDNPVYPDQYGVWIGSTSAGKYYRFFVKPDTASVQFGNYGISYFDGSQPIWLGKGGGTSNAVNMETAVNFVKVHRCGTRYYFYANDTLLTTVVLPELAGQHLSAGYYVKTQSNAIVRLDNFRIQNVAP
ncbi:MAG: hypothetical protein KA765_02270 [Thermoflexales bacterium]|nr:hypothetical protein [Thermoflexales bacterium]